MSAIHDGVQGNGSAYSRSRQFLTADAVGHHLRKLPIALFPPVTLEFTEHVRMVSAGGEAWRRETCRKTVPRCPVVTIDPRGIHPLGTPRWPKCDS
jgi:hypothetical protein